MRLSRPSLSGQSFVEFGLLLPVLTLLMVGSIDLARVFYTKVTIANASRVAAEFAVNPIRYDLNDYNLDAASLEIRQRAVDEASGFVDMTVDDVTFTGTFEAGTKFRVTVQARYTPLTPLVAQLVGGDVLTLSHTTALRHNCTAISTCDY